MSVHIIYYKDGAKLMRPVKDETEYRLLRDAERNRTADKHHMVQMNYSCLPNENGALKGATRLSRSVGMDIDFDPKAPDYEAKMAQVPELVMGKKKELGLLMLERSANKGYHIVFRRRPGLSQEENLKWASRLLVDTGNSYQGLCEMIRRKTNGADGVYFTYTEEKPISFNPFYTDDYVFDVEKKDSIKTLLLTLWKSEDDKVTKTESGELGSAVSAYIGRIKADRTIVPSFNTFYEYMRDDYRRELAERDIKVEKSDFNIDNMLTTMRQYYRGGRYDFLLNSTENIDLLSKRFIVFEIDSIRDNKELFPVVTIIIMEAFINKMRRLKGVRKQLICEEAWKALASANMATYIQYLYKTVRKYFGEAIVVTQEVDDIISSPIVKESIINNSDCKILLDQRKYMNKFDTIQSLLGLTEKEKSQILSINMANNPSRLYKEVWVGLGGTQSAVYATEVSTEEYLAYTTEETEKVEVYRLAEQLGGDIEAAIRQLAERRRNKQ